MVAYNIVVHLFIYLPVKFENFFDSLFFSYEFWNHAVQNLLLLSVHIPSSNMCIGDYSHSFVAYGDKSISIFMWN